MVDDGFDILFDVHVDDDVLDRLFFEFSHLGSDVISNDDGKTWSAPRPLTGATEKNIQVSNERAMMRTKDGTIIAAFMNLNQRKWTWSNELFDAPGAELPTWVMRSEDDGETWTHVSLTWVVEAEHPCLRGTSFQQQSF